MNRSKKHLLRNMAAAVLLCAGFASCSQDDLPGQGDSLPEGKYPLEISSVTMSVESSEEPWGASHAPQTRVSENPDGSSSKWDGGEKIYVQVGNGTLGTYVLNADGTIDASQSQPAYWGSNTNGQTVKAWHTSPNHTSGDGTTVTLSNQSGGLAYILKNSEPSIANFGDKINLKFSHALAKIRVELTGREVGDDTSVSIKSYTSCTVTQGTVQDATPGEIKMRKTAKGTFEANVVPGYWIEQFKINDGDWINLTTSVMPVAGNWHKIGIEVSKGSLQPVDGKFTVNADDDVLIKDYTGTAPIVVNGNATITIENVTLTTTETVMTINNDATVTLNVKGIDNKFTSTAGSGIEAYENSNIIIKGDASNKSKLIVNTGEITNDDSRPQNVNVGIGFQIEDYGKKTSGNIIISDVALDITVGKNALSDEYNSAAIGLSGRNPSSVGNVTCGDIKITNSIVTCSVDAESTAACIGTNHWAPSDRSALTMGGIYIENSTITASSGANKDWGDPGICIGLGYVGIGTATMKTIEIKESTLNLTSKSTYSVGKVNGGGIITDGIVVDESNKGTTGWNP